MPTRRPASWAVVLMTVVLLAACDAGPVVTGPPAVGNPTPAPSSGSPGPGEAPFSRASWPASGSACGTEGYTGNLGRIEATEARTVVFTLCAPDGAFLSRVAHPALGILDAATIAGLATNPDSARSLAGTGPYRIDHWTPGQNVRLVRAGDAASADAKVPTLVLTWADDPTQRTLGLQSATVDGIDAPEPADLDRIATLPELAVFPRDGLATAYLGFGTGAGLGKVAVRRALGGALDRDTLATDGFAAGSIAATHLTPCEIDGGCGGTDWYGFNAPAASAALAAAKFDLGQTYTLHIPDRPVPGLPDPAGLAEAVAAQLETNIGLHTEIDTMPFRDYQADLATGKLDGLFLGGIASSLADPGAFLEPLFGADVRSTAADRTPKAAPAIEEAATTVDPAARANAFGRANDAIRDAAALVPLAHPGSVAAFRADVMDVVTSPLGLDPLGRFTPGDRSQLVFMQAEEPDGAYCGDQVTSDAYRLCGLVVEGLYGFKPGTMTVEPRLAQCEPNAPATVWTCRLRQGVTFQDGARLDAGDVLATYVAQWDRSRPQRAQSPAPFANWDALFGGTIGPQ
jgi:peptide/nickel transport system substrate-binding protein